MDSKFLEKYSKGRKLMLGAIVLNAVSQFLPYSEASFGAMFGEGTSTIGSYNYGVTGIGWAVHWHAVPILAVLAWFFVREAAEELTGLGRWGWWPAAVLIWLAILPGTATVGVCVGLASVALAIWAVVTKRRERKAEAAAKAQAKP